MVFDLWSLTFEFLFSSCRALYSNSICYKKFPKIEDQRPFLMYQIRKIIRIVLRFDRLDDRLSINQEKRDQRADHRRQ